MTTIATTEAAAEAGVTADTIRTWCRRNVIAAVKQAGRWIIDTASLAHRIAIGAMRTRKEAQMTQQQPQPPATDRQVSYIMSLINKLADSDFGLEYYDGPTSKHEVQALSQAQASNLIENLKGLPDGPC
ncbi:hypothetical protein [Streptomyces sp. ME19-01-6]|uniref:hypothetical protein n=1 Tax=Streptomyces sp. ME19-01-6 TaxID=3028686 RepID=UPI0029B15D22|nr:hypothetical protein [Streptomyces sp. ME19-01-6]MDX3230614.1 hypothetical protein [Streptomyces sp. ME19-01-6]